MQTDRKTQDNKKYACMRTHKYTLSQQGLATIVHRYIFIPSVPIVTTEIEFPLELWNSDSLFFVFTNKKLKDAGVKLGFKWSVLCFSCLSRASRTSDSTSWFWWAQLVLGPAGHSILLCRLKRKCFILINAEKIAVRKMNKEKKTFFFNWDTNR